MKLTDNELYNIEGGAIKSFQQVILFLIGGLIVLITGIIDGYTNPLKCNN